MKQPPTTGNAPRLSAVSSAPNESTSKHPSRSATATDAGWSQLSKDQHYKHSQPTGRPIGGVAISRAPHIDSGRRVLGIRQFDDADDATLFVSAFGPRVDKP